MIGLVLILIRILFVIGAILIMVRILYVIGANADYYDVLGHRGHCSWPSLPAKVPSDLSQKMAPVS